MKISTKGRYGLRAMIDLAAHSDEKSVTLKSLSARLGVSDKYLEQLLSPMKNQGMIKSIRGAQGGYVLAKSADEIYVGDIINVLEGGMYPVDCLGVSGVKDGCGAGSCVNCVTRPVWAKIYDSVNSALNSFTLADLAEDYKA